MLRGAAVLGAASLTPWQTACGEDGDDALTFFFQANPEEADARMRIIDAFSRAHPDIAVRTVLSGPDPMQQMSTFCAGGKCPDVLMAWELTYAGLADRGVLLDLSTMLARDRAFAAELNADSIAALYETFTFGTASTPCRSNGRETSCSTTGSCSPRPTSRPRPPAGTSRGVSPNSSTRQGHSPNATAPAGSPSGVSSTPGFRTTRPGCSA